MKAWVLEYKRTYTGGRIMTDYFVKNWGIFNEMGNLDVAMQFKTKKDAIEFKHKYGLRYKPVLVEIAK